MAPMSVLESLADPEDVFNTLDKRLFVGMLVPSPGFLLLLGLDIHSKVCC